MQSKATTFKMGLPIAFMGNRQDSNIAYRGREPERRALPGWSDPSVLVPNNARRSIDRFMGKN
jgi:hypothetical protein